MRRFFAGTVGCSRQQRVRGLGAAQGLLAALASALWLGSAPVRADEVKVAVAANFAATLEAVAPEFQKQTGHTLAISVGATGALYAQIKHGAPFDVLLSADDERPKQLEQEGLGVPGTRFVYARGKLALWSARAGFVDTNGQVLKKKELGKLGIADPATAPYGAAAREVLSKLGQWERLWNEGAIVIGTSVTHAFQFAASGNASCAFVAYAQVVSAARKGSHWLVPQALYAPLDQEAILLKAGAASEAARALLRFLDRDARALALLRKSGYEKPKR
ncbi:MAG TPA: molybdate ABC transporter substrate-binding protein [Polyangiales bacterium]